MGSIRLCRGDVFKTTSDAIAHGCNVRGAMGAGIAYTFKRMYPDMYEQYKYLCDHSKLMVGDIFKYTDGTLDGRPITIYNLMSQTGFDGADAAFLMQSFMSMVEDANSSGIKEITIPMIGAGLGELQPTVCLNIFLTAAEVFNGRINVVVQYVEDVVPEPIMDGTHDPRKIFKRSVQAAKEKAARDKLAELKSTESK